MNQSLCAGVPELHGPRDEADRLYAWRLKYALDLGLSLSDAERIASTRRDLHELEDDVNELLERGCSRETALAIAS